MIFDAQVHIARPGEGRWEELPESGLPISVRRRRQEEHDIQRLPDGEQLLEEMDRAGVDAAALIPSMNPLVKRDNGPSLELAGAHPDRFVVMGRIDGLERDKAVGLLDEWRDRPELKGLRVNARVAPVADWIWEEGERRELTVMVYPPAEGVAEWLDEVLGSYPNLKLVIDHLGLDAFTIYDDITPHIDALLPAARHPNVAVKASALPAALSEGFPFPAAQRALLPLIEAFGSARVFWGSDLSRSPCPYEQVLRMFTEGLSGISETERQDILGDALARWLNWEPMSHMKEGSS